MKFLVLFVFLLLKESICDESYKNFKAYDVTPNKDQVTNLMEWQYEDGVDFWTTGAAGRTSKVMIPPALQKEFETFLINQNITSAVIVENVEDFLKEDKLKRLKYRKGKSSVKSTGEPDFSVFWTIDEMETYCIQLAQRFPNLVTREVIGISAEGRELFAMKISNGIFGQKPIIFLEAGTHAREWAAHASAFYLLHQLIEVPASTQELLANVDWIIIPVVNPDGYHHSFTVNRMWRQNRRRINSTCIGVDLNRNYAFSWAEPRANSCGNQVYSGPYAFSEPESLAVHKYLEAHRTNVPLYVSVHTFGDMVLYPWGFEGSPGLAPNWQHHHALGLLFANAIRNATGKQYVVGNIADVLGNAFGAADDHAYGYVLINLVFTLELTGGGITGFDFPEEQIEALVKETFLGYREFGFYIGQNAK